MPVDHEIDSRNKNIQIYINGSFYHRDEAKISVYDSGFLMGDGIWEGLRLINNKWIFIDEHVDRLFEGCKAIDLDIKMTKEDIVNALDETKAINNMSNEVHARLMITRGNKSKPFQQPHLSESGINIVIIMEHSKPSIDVKNITMATVPQVRGMPMSQDPKLNSHSKLNCILACIQANKLGADEALMLDPLGFVNTTNSCNFFIVKNNQVWTSTGDYCMNGVTRQNIINLCKENDIPIYEKNFSLVDVYSADEAFITGTLGSLTNVTSIDNRNIGKNNNPISDKLRNYYKKLL
jgi:branched-chain amino acid aminotransferase